MILLKDMVFIIIMMEQDIQDFGKMEKKMEKESSFKKIHQLIKELLKMIKRMVQVH